ncbi:uncharacterized protein LOC128931544 [Callithrix jacchus]
MKPTAPALPRTKPTARDTVLQKAPRSCSTCWFRVRSWSRNGPRMLMRRCRCPRVSSREAFNGGAGRLNIPKSGFCRVCGGWGRGEAAGSLFSAWCQVRSSRCQESCSGLGRTGRWRAGPSLLFGVCCVDVEVCWLQPPSLRRGCRGCGGGRGSGGLAPPQAWSWWSSLRSGLRPSAGCAGLTTGLLPQGVLSQATGGHAAGGLVGGFRVLCRLQHCGHEWEGGLPEKEAGPPVTRVSLGDTWGVGNGFRGALGTTAGAVAGSGTQAALRGEVPSAARGAGTPSPPALRGPAGGAQLLLPALPDQPPVHVRLPPAFISGLSGGFASSSSSFVKKSSVPSMSSVFQRSFLVNSSGGYRSVMLSSLGAPPSSLDMGSQKASHKRGPSPSIRSSLFLLRCTRHSGTYSSPCF